MITVTKCVCVCVCVSMLCSVDDAVRLFLQKGAYWCWTCFVLFDDQLTRNLHPDLALCSSVC